MKGLTNLTILNCTISRLPDLDGKQVPWQVLTLVRNNLTELPVGLLNAPNLTVVQVNQNRLPEALNRDFTNAGSSAGGVCRSGCAAAGNPQQAKQPGSDGLSANGVSKSTAARVDRSPGRHAKGNRLHTRHYPGTCPTRNGQSFTSFAKSTKKPWPTTRKRLVIVRSYENSKTPIRYTPPGRWFLYGYEKRPYWA